MQFNDIADQRQADAETRVGPAHQRIRLGEHLEHALGVFWRHADAVVAHGDDDLSVLHLHLQVDLAARRGVLDRVGEQVRQHLVQSQRIGIELDRVGGNVDFQHVPGRVEERPRRLERGFDDRRQQHLLAMQFEPPESEPGDIQQVVHQALHRLGLPPHHLSRRLAIAAAHAGRQQQGCGAVDRRQRVAQLMRQHRQEAVLGRVRLLQRTAGLLVLDQRLHQFRLAVLQRLLRFPRRGLVSQNFNEPHGPPLRVAHEHHRAAGPEQAAVLAHMEAVVGRTAFGQRGFRLVLGRSGLPVFHAEDDVAAAAQHLGFGISQQPLRPAVPDRDAAVQVHRKDCKVACALHHEPQSLFAALQGLSRLFLRSDVARDRGPADHFVQAVLDRGDAQCHMDQAAVLAAAHTLEVVDGAALAQHRRDLLLVACPRHVEQCQRMPDGLGRVVAEHFGSAGIPAEDCEVQRETDDAVHG